MFTNSEPFIFAGVSYPAHHVYWRFNDAGQPVHITVTAEVMARGGDANAQPFTNVELAAIPGLPT